MGGHYLLMDGWDLWMYSWTERQTDGCKDRQTNRSMNKQMDRLMNGQTVDRQTDVKTNKHMNGQRVD